MTKPSPDELWYLYLVETAHGQLYTGISNNVAQRFEKHLNGSGAKYLRGKGPLTLIGAQAVANRSVASRLEYQFKRLPAQQKRRLISNTALFGDFLDKSLFD